MDLFMQGTLFVVALLIFATLWNMFNAPKEKKDPKKFFQYFIEKYKFTASDDASVFNGFYKGKSVQIRAEPLSVFIPVTNPRGIHLLLEKGKETEIPDLVDTPVPDAGELRVKSNYPMIVSEMLDERFVKKLLAASDFSFELREGITLTCPPMRKVAPFEELLSLAVQLQQKLEQVNYAYQT